MYRLIFTISVIFVITFEVNSQEKKIATQNINSETLSILEKSTIPDLNVFIESALKNSPLLQVSDKEKEKILEQIKMQKKSWTDFIQIDANTRYGLYNQLTVSNQAVADVPPVGVQSDKQQLNYYAGVTLKLPISYFANKKNELKILNYNIQESELRKEQLKKEITQFVIDEYFKFKNYRELLDSYQTTLQTMKISYLKSVKDVENGTLGFSEFSTITYSYSKAEESYSKLKSDYYTQIYKLQILTGINLQNTAK
jgi:outer membrane protein TolC